MSVTYNRRPLFANGTKIYSIFSRANGLTTAFVGEYTGTGTIASLIVQGQTLLASVGTGIDKNGTAFATTTIETHEIQEQIQDIIIKYDSYPAGVTLFVSLNGGAYVEKTLIADTIRKQLTFNGGIADGYTAKIKVVLTPSGANRPAIKSINIT